MRGPRSIDDGRGLELGEDTRETEKRRDGVVWPRGQALTSKKRYFPGQWISEHLRTTPVLRRNWRTRYGEYRRLIPQRPWQEGRPLLPQTVQRMTSSSAPALFCRRVGTSCLSKPRSGSATSSPERTARSAGARSTSPSSHPIVKALRLPGFSLRSKV
jgi:hypothetical protein